MCAIQEWLIVISLLYLLVAISAESKVGGGIGRRRGRTVNWDLPL